MIMKDKTLDLKVTVASYDEDPDTVLHKMLTAGHVRLTAVDSTRLLRVTRVERADGEPFGLNAAFAEYWNTYRRYGMRLDGSEAQDEARQAFMYAARKFGKGK